MPPTCDRSSQGHCSAAPTLVRAPLAPIPLQPSQALLCQQGAMQGLAKVPGPGQASQPGQGVQQVLPTQPLLSEQRHGQGQALGQSKSVASAVSEGHTFARAPLSGDQPLVISLVSSDDDEAFQQWA